MTIQNSHHRNSHAHPSKRSVDKSPGPTCRRRSRSIPRGGDGRGRSTIRRAPPQRHDRQLTPAPLKYPMRYSSLERRTNNSSNAARTAAHRKSLNSLSSTSCASLPSAIATADLAGPARISSIRSTHSSASEPETAANAGSAVGLSPCASFHSVPYRSVGGNPITSSLWMLGGGGGDHHEELEGHEDLSFSSGRASLL